MRMEPKVKRRPPVPAEFAAAQQAVADAAASVIDAQNDLEQAILSLRRMGASMALIAEASGYTPAGILGMLRRYGVA